MVQAKRDAWSLSNTKYLLCFYTTFSNPWLNVSMCLTHFYFPWQSTSQRSSSWGSFPDTQPKFSSNFFLSDDCLFLARWCKQHARFPHKVKKVLLVTYNGEVKIPSFQELTQKKCKGDHLKKAASDPEPILSAAHCFYTQQVLKSLSNSMRTNSQTQKHISYIYIIYTYA